MSAIDDVQAERHRQVSAEGWTPQHDDTHANREMALAAFAYLGNALEIKDFDDSTGVPAQWPWDFRWFKPTDYRRDLVKAAALVVAEIERLDRAAASTSASE